MRNMNKKLLIALSLCCVLGVVGVTAHAYQSQLTSEDRKETVATLGGKAGANGNQSELAVDDVEVVTTFASLAIDISDPAVMWDNSTNIVLARVDSIDGSSNYSDVTDDYVYPYTYGHMTVIENFKGELPVDESVEFYKIGGTVSTQQYYNSMAEAQREKFDVFGDKSKISDSKFIKQMFSGDIDVEVGKTYVMYLGPETAYHAKPGTYAIFGFQGGLREVQTTSGGLGRSASSQMVLNNFTGEWEELKDLFNERQ